MSKVWVVGVADVGCERCNLVYSAILRRGGASWLGEVARDTGLRDRAVKRHLRHLVEMGFLEQDVLGLYRVR